jgi:hypothetical protein
MQNRGYKKMYGGVVKDDILEINEITNDISEALEAGDTEMLIYYAGMLSRCVAGGQINADYDELRSSTAAAVFAYATAPHESGLSPAALEILQKDAREKNSLLHDTTQFIMGKLNSTDTSKMNLNYFKTLSPNSRVHKLISSFISKGGEN